MKRLNIAVLVDKHHSEYTVEIIKGIHDYYKDKNVNLIISEVSIPHFNKGYFEYQKWSASRILSADCIDSAIFISASFCNYIPADELSQYFQNFKSKNNISIGIKLNLKNCSYTKVNINNIYYELIKHLKEEHNCKRIAFMSANLTSSIESKNRQLSFLEAMKLNNLTFYKEDQTDANFTTKIAEEELRKKYKTKEDIKFDAIVAANDLMAVGCINYFHSLGLKIPEELKVVGFDDAYISKMSIPPLTTINQNVYLQGYKAAELAMKAAQKEKIPIKNSMDLSIKYRNSCGCKICENKNTDSEQLQIDYFEITSQLSKTNNTLDTVQNVKTLDDVYNTLPDLINLGGFSGIGIILYEKPIFNKKEDTFKLPHKAYPIILIDKEKNYSIYEKNKKLSFDPHKTIFPIKIDNINPNNYILQPIFYGEKNYGYMMLKITKISFSYYSVIVKIYANMIAQAYEFTKTLLENSELSEKNSKLTSNNTTLEKISISDELTKLYNRRGFMEKGQEEIIKNTNNSNSKGLIIFADLDKLKNINDSYGHKIGDKALKTMAQVLKKSFRSTDIIGRLSGDEFSIIVPGLSEHTFEKIHKKINENFEFFSIKNKLPIIVSASFGFTEYNSSCTNLKQLLEKADETLYKEKKLKKENNFSLKKITNNKTN